MAIYISGGSNSVSEDGWVGRFRALTQGQDVKNISIGAAPSHMGLFRTSCTVDLGPGDTVLWEYGINDAAHIQQRGYDPAVLLKAVEAQILHCADREAKFCALIFQPRFWEKLGRRHPYIAGLHSLFERHGVRRFDVSDEFVSARPGRTHLPLRLYKDRAHYAKDDRFLDFIARGARRAVAEASVPSARGKVRSLGFHDHFDGGRRTFFENKRVSVSATAPGNDPITLRLDGAGRVLGLVIVSTPLGGAFEVSVGGRSFVLSATYRERKFNKTMVKFVSLPTLIGEDLEFNRGDTVRIGWAETANGMLADHRFRRKLGADQLNGKEAAVVSALVEQHPA